jgi:cysteine-rich repeat protein
MRTSTRFLAVLILIGINGSPAKAEQPFEVLRADRAVLMALAVCGNSLLEDGEQCDDGNGVSGDGCSDTCQVEDGFDCSIPVPPDTTNLLADPGFEAGTPNPSWDEASSNFDTPICDLNSCVEAGQRSGLFWVWFGGIELTSEEGSVSQSITIPSTASEIRFWLNVPSPCDSADDFVEVLVDGAQAWGLTGDDASCGDNSYQEKVVDISTWADDGVHLVEFHSKTFSTNGGFTDFFLDDVLLINGPPEPIPSICTDNRPDLIFNSSFEDL